MPSKTNNLIRTSLPGWCGLAALACTLFFIRRNEQPSYINAVIAIGVLFAVMFMVEATLCIRGKFGLISAKPQRALNLNRILTKILGWIATISIVSSAYWIFPEYAGSFYDSYYKALALTWPYLTAFFLACILWEDLTADEAEDDYYFVGLALLKFNRLWLKNINLKQHFLRWAVKLYFLPLMFVYLVGYINPPINTTGFISLYDNVFNFIFFVDTAIVCVGYVFANNLTDTNIRSTDPTLLGWFCTLICYQPFWSFVGLNYLHYSGAWGPWLSNHSTLQIIWGSLIILFLSLYIWASIAFGSRFSNLTHRGILTCGPYAYLRHPAYIGKLGSFFLMYVPFIGDSPLSILRNLIGWGLLVGVYYLRAKTEEAHLRSVGPEYDLYSQEVTQKWKNIWA